jgi:hypothetical protein
LRFLRQKEIVFLSHLAKHFGKEQSLRGSLTNLNKKLLELATDSTHSNSVLERERERERKRERERERERGRDIKNISNIIPISLHLPDVFSLVCGVQDLTALVHPPLQDVSRLVQQPGRHHTETYLYSKCHLNCIGFCSCKHKRLLRADLNGNLIGFIGKHWYT